VPTVERLATSATNSGTPASSSAIALMSPDGKGWAILEYFE